VGDLDAIVLKATRSLPEERYASADELAADLGRYLDRRPVLARGGALAYRVQRFVARHRGGAAAAAIALVAVVAGIGGVLWQASIARHERRVAEARFNDVRQLARAMIFELYDGIAELPGSTAARQALVTKALRYFDGLARDEVNDSALALELASAYLRVAGVQFDTSYANLGDTAGALASFAKARRILDARLSADGSDRAARRLLARTHLATGAVQLYLRQWTQARDSIETGVRLREALAADGDETDRRELAGAYLRLADVIAVQDPAAAIVHRRRALQMFEALLAAHPGDQEAQRSMALASKTLGSALIDLQRPDEAEPHLVRALALDEQRVAASPNSALARLDLSFDLSLFATLRMNREDYRGALEYWNRTIAARKALVDADPNDARAKGRLAFAYLRSSSARFELGDFSGGIEVARSALALAEGLSAANPNDVVSRSYAAQAWRQIGHNERGRARRAAGRDRTAHETRACAAFGRSLDAYQQNIATGRADAADRKNAEALRTALASCRGTSTRR
jgi:non-specific serine/threonine protein kinase/serine/threonine-protein kinase